MRFFFGTHGACFVLVRIIEASFLIHGATGLNNCDLALGFIVNRRLDEAHRVHVLDLAACAEMREILRFHVFLILPRTTNRHVHIGPQVAVLHVAVTGAQIAQQLAQFGHVGCGFFRATDIRAGDDLHQSNACTVVIHERHVWIHVMHGFARVLFKVDTFNAHLACNARLHIDDDFAFAHDRVIELRNLIALWQIRVEIVLAIKGRLQVNLCLEAQSGAHCLLNTELIDNRQHSGHRRVNERHVGVWLCAKLRGGPREEFRIRAHLRMDFHPDHEFPVVFRAGDDFGFRGFICQVQHRLRLHKTCARRRSRTGRGQGQEGLRIMGLLGKLGGLILPE